MTSTLDTRPTTTGRLSPVSLTPHRAWLQDLLCVRGELDHAGIPFLLIRGADGRPALALDGRQRALFAQTMLSACLDEPWFAKTLDGGTKRKAVSIAEGRLSQDSDPRLVRVFRRRDALTGRSGLRYGASAAVEVQFWVYDGEQVLCPTETSITRRALEVSDMVHTTVDLYGRTWPTISGMFLPHAADIAFDIDVVFSWVDGSDPELRARRASFMDGYRPGEGDGAVARTRQIEELKYALRSVWSFAPWVRKIFIATDSPVPSWLRPHPRIAVVRAEDHFTDLGALPVFNSHAVESQLHHIPGLSEHFLYSNDDMFFGRPLDPSMFFSPGGITKFIEAGTRIGLGGNHPERSGFENAARVNRQLLWDRFGQFITRHLEHTAVPLRKSVLTDLEREFPEDFARTRRSRFRCATDISVTNSLYHYYAFMTGRAVQQESARVLYVDTTAKAGLAKLPGLVKKRDYDFFCLNDGSFPEVGDTKRARMVTQFLEQYFPVPAPWERVGGEEGD